MTKSSGRAAAESKERTEKVSGSVAAAADVPSSTYFWGFVGSGFDQNG